MHRDALGPARHASPMNLHSLPQLSRSIRRIGEGPSEVHRMVIARNLLR